MVKHYSSGEVGGPGAGDKMGIDFYSGTRPRKITGDTMTNSKVRIIRKADPEKVKAYRQSEEYRAEQRRLAKKESFQVIHKKAVEKTIDREIKKNVQ